MGSSDTNQPTLMVTTIVVLFGVSMLGGFLFIIRSRSQVRGVQERARHAQEWVRKMDELGIGFQMPALHEVVVGGTCTWADPWERDLTKFNKKTWNEFMVGKWLWKHNECRLNDDPRWGDFGYPALVGDS